MNEIKRPTMSRNKQILFSFLVIALNIVIAVNCISDAPESGPSADKNVAAVAESNPALPATILTPKPDQSVSPGSDSSPLDKSDDAKLSVQEALAKVDSDAIKRKARSESSPASSAPPTEAKPPADKVNPSTTKSATTEAKTGAPKAASSKQVPAAAIASSSASSASAKVATKSKLPANLGTVTSTGSGGPAHYMSKHDAYSAIAEKHGALAQDAMRKSDKRQLQGFGSIQKASGLGDMFGPFKSVSDSGLARTLGASMRSIMKSKYSVPAYVASALLGAVALMAFYESPISPLPVPALPEPPVGRFPPEMPNISPNAQVPFRTNQQQYNQQNYNQRSLYSGFAPQPSGQNYPSQQGQQILFPGASSNNNAQQRQMNTGPISSGPVQLAANLLGKQQVAQRKSGADYDQSTSRSFFSPSSAPAQPKQGATPGSQDSQQKQNSLLSFLGLGGNASPSAATDLPSAGKMAAQAALAAAAATNSNNNNQIGSQLNSLSSQEPKGQSGSGLYNSNLVNKFKSFFTRSPAQPSSSATSSFLSAHPLGPYDQYQRMSFVQALLKDNNFLPGFLSPSRKSSSTPTGPNQSLSGNKLQLVSNAIASATSGTSPIARMQVSGDSNQANGANSLSSQQGAAGKKPSGSSSGYGLARVAHALLETFTSGMTQRSAQSSSVMDNSGRKSGFNDDIGQSSSSPITSILTDVISSAVYSAAEQQLQQSGEQVAPKSASSQQQQQHSSSTVQQSNSNGQEGPAAGRSLDAPAIENHANAIPTKSTQQQVSEASSGKQQQSSTGSAVASNEAGHVRKTRSIGLDYANDGNQELYQREQPSKATQINSVIDYVADSYTQNRLLFNFVMKQVGLSHAVPYFEQILASDGYHH